jgi:hypothetical protein
LSFDINLSAFRTYSQIYQYPFNRLRGIFLDLVLPLVQEDKTIELEDLPTGTQLLEEAFADSNRVATTERVMLEIE